MTQARWHDPDAGERRLLIGAAGCKARVIVSSGADAARLEAAVRIGTGCGLSMAGILPKPFSPAALRALFGEASG